MTLIEAAEATTTTTAARQAGAGATEPQALGWAPSVTAERVRVFEYEPDLLAGIDAPTAALLRRRVPASCVRLRCGPWSPAATDAALDEPGGGGVLGLLVLDGLITRCTRVYGRDCAELLGPGDLLRPWDPPVAAGAIESSSTWRVLSPTRIAVLDARFAAVAGRWPSITSALLTRAALRTRGLAFNLAIAHIRQAETRLLVLFWQLAERWGRVTPDGVVLPLPLTHELLGQLVCLHRPTTSTALARLTRAGRIARRTDRGWTLLGQAPVLDDEAADVVELDV